MKSIGEIIREYRTRKNMTQEELGKLVFVSKQAVSKWETGRTLPDVETVRLLCDVLEINRDEILGKSVEQIKNNRRWIKVLICLSIVCALIALFFVLDGVGYIDRNTQSSVAYLSIFEDGQPMNTDEFSVNSDISAENFENGYKFEVSYGEIRGVVNLPDGYSVEYGFMNTNNWHNIQIRLDVKTDREKFSVTQTITYATDDNVFAILVDESSTKDDKRLSVFCSGV